jgi:hypothetical protein
MKFLNNKLPSELVQIISEYADPLYVIKKDIVNKRYNLNDLMYAKMKNILNIYFKEHNSFLLDFKKYITVSKSTMNDPQYKQNIITYYKNYYLSKATLENNFNKHKLKFDVLENYRIDSSLCAKFGNLQDNNYYKIWRQL